MIIKVEGIEIRIDEVGEKRTYMLADPLTNQEFPPGIELNRGNNGRITGRFWGEWSIPIKELFTEYFESTWDRSPEALDTTAKKMLVLEHDKQIGLEPERRARARRR